MAVIDTSTVILFLELHRRLAAYSVGELTDQFFMDVEQSNSRAFTDLDVAMHGAFMAHAETVMKRVADNEDT